LQYKIKNPAKAIVIKEKCERMEYMIEVYTDGNKSENGVDFGIAIFIDKHLTFTLKYKLGERCSNNQASKLQSLKSWRK